MLTRKSRFTLSVLSAAFVLLLPAYVIFAQEDDPDPNSPTPVLLTLDNSTRALAVPKGRLAKTDLSKVQPQAFNPDSKIQLFITNIELMRGEKANAFRVYIEDKNGRQYRFPVIGMDLVDANKNIYSLTVLLKDEINYWEPPTPDGDVLVMVTWRGLASNRVRLGFGAVGGNFNEDAGTQSAPLSKATGRIVKNEGPTADFVGYRFAGDRARMQEQAAFGWSPVLDNRIRRIGLRAWLTSQWDEPYPSLNNPYPNQPLKPGTEPADCDGDQTTPDVPVTCHRDTYTMYQPQTWFMREAFYGDAQLRHRIAWALSQIWVTSGVDIQQGRHIVEWHKVLSRNAFGNYRTLMKEMTLNPTMGDYLSMSQSTKNNPNENYAREIMQLFTVGLFMLNQDGTLQTSGGNPIPTYDQNVVNNLTKVFTGWSFCQTQGTGCPNLAVGTVNYIDPMLLNVGVTNINNNRHDLTAKTLLSYTSSTTTNIAACSNCTTLPNVQTYADASMNQALDNIFNHPNVGPFVSKILIQQLVTSDPTPAYVSRVAAVFNANRQNPTQLKEVVKAILLDPEARGDVKTDPNYGKLREPVQLATGILRTFNVRSASGAAQSDGYLTGRAEFNGMAEIPFMSPTVFNYYPPNYMVPNTTLLGPEFALMTTGTTIQRANFVNRFAFTAIPVAVSTDAPNGTSLDFSDLQAISATDSTGGALVDALNLKMLHGTMSSQMRSTIMTAVTSIAATDTLGRVRQAVYLVATSSQYQVQR